MGFIIPIINRDISEINGIIRNKINEEKVQKRLVLVIVSIALLLDNMLYMVIVPIVPDYLRRIGAYVTIYPGANKTINGTIVYYEKGGTPYYKNEDQSLGWLFAIKAIVQLLVNPFSGTIIDRIGYELPLIIGLVVMFTSTAVFALGQSYGVLFVARSLQGVGSAFADTSGLAMIADRFTEEHERTKAMGIALAFISFGCLVAPPFGGVLYEFAGKPVPFMVLSLICLLDGFMVFMVIQPKTRRTESGERVQGTPIHRLFADPFILICSGALIMANVSLAFLEPTIAKHMEDTMPGISEWKIGLIWLPAFFPHVAGVCLTVVLVRRNPQWPWILSAIGLAMEGLSCLFIPFITNYWVMILPLSVVCFGIALIDTALLPMLGYLVDTRHVSVYGSVYAIADISYSMAYAFGPIVAGGIMSSMGFLGLNVIICLSNIIYAPFISFLRRVYVYKPFDSNEMNGYSSDQSFNKGYGTLDGSHEETTTTTSSINGRNPFVDYGYDYPQDGRNQKAPSYPPPLGANLGGVHQPQQQQQQKQKGKELVSDTLYEKKVKKKKYRGYKDTDCILQDEDDEEDV